MLVTGCSRFRAQAYEKPPPGKLPATRTQGLTPFEVGGIDFAGPMRYRTKGKAEEGLSGALWLQSDACSAPRDPTVNGSCRIHIELKKVYCQTWSAEDHIFGQRKNLQSCRQMAEESTKRREVASIPGR